MISINSIYFIKSFFIGKMEILNCLKNILSDVSNKTNYLLLWTLTIITIEKENVRTGHLTKGNVIILPNIEYSIHLYSILYNTLYTIQYTLYNTLHSTLN